MSEELMVIDITRGINAFEVPCCPLCDHPIDDIDIPAMGGCIVDEEITYCLIHRDCGLNLSKSTEQEKP